MARSSTTWQKGQTSPNPGRKPRPVEQRYAEIFREACTPADWQAICARAVSDAKQGDARARAWLGEYLIGRPPQTLNIGTADAALLQQAIEALTLARLSPAEVFAELIAEARQVQHEQEE